MCVVESTNMSPTAIILLISAVSSLIPSGLSYRQETLFEIISKDKTTDVSMHCSSDGETGNCTWHLGPLRILLGVEDPPEELDDRYQVEVDSLLKICYLHINNINFQDEGFYECSFGGALAQVGWGLSIQGDPGYPAISYSNGIQIDDTTIAVDVAPITIQLTCTSTRAKPRHEKMFWLIDGKPVSQATSWIMEPEEGGSWKASSNASFSFSEDDLRDFAVKRVTCITQHATGETSNTKVFGVRNTDKTLRLIHDNTTGTTYGKITCETNVFPWPIMYEIVKLSNPPSVMDELTFKGKEMEIKEEGRYICRAVIVTRTRPTRMYRWVDSNVLGIGVDPDCPPGGSSKTNLEVFLVTACLGILFWNRMEV